MHVVTTKINYQHVFCITHNCIVSPTVYTIYSMLLDPFYYTNPLFSYSSFCPSFFVSYIHLHFISYKNMPNFLSNVILLSFISSFWVLSEGLYPHCCVYNCTHIAVCTVKNSWSWTEELSQTCRVLFQKQIWEISASSWFYYKNCCLRCGHGNEEVM